MNRNCIYCYIYATETYIMHFLEAAQFLNSPVLAECKVNLLLAPGLAARLPYPPQQLLGSWNNHSVLICIKLPMNLLIIWCLALMILLLGKDITMAIGRVGPKKSQIFWAQTALALLELFHGPILPMACILCLPHIKIITAPVLLSCSHFLVFILTFI